MERAASRKAGCSVTSLTSSPSRYTRRPSRSDLRYSVPVRSDAAAALVALAGPAYAQTTTGNVAMGQSLYTSKGCLGCHAATGPTKANAMNAGGHIAHANTQGMGGQADTNGQEYNDIAAYLATLFVEQGLEAVAFNTVRRVDVANVVLRTALPHRAMAATARRSPQRVAPQRTVY